MLKGWWAGKTKARLAAKASGAIGKLSKEIGREAMPPVAGRKIDFCPRIACVDLRPAFACRTNSESIGVKKGTHASLEV